MTVLFHVAGNAHVSHAPERATVTVQIAVTDTESGAAYESAVAYHNEVVAVAKERESSGAVVSWEAEAPTSYSYRDHFSSPDGESSARTVYATRTVIRIVFQDFSAMGRLLADFSDNEFTAITVSWDLTEETRMELERSVRIQAVQNARRLAEDYAEGDGISATKENLLLESISDHRDSSNFGGATPRVAAATRSLAPVAEFSPREITVSASVSAVYRALEV